MNINIHRYAALEHDTREYLRKPWIEDGRTVATNGHICISLDAVLSGDIEAAPSDKMKGRVPKIIAAAADAPASLAIADVDLQKVPCTHCAGSGFAQLSPCQDCDGDGEFEHGRHWYSCKECNGEGIHATPCDQDADGAKGCWSCQATGHDSKSRTNVGNVVIANRYLALLKDLPNCRLALHEHPDQPVRFDFDGGTGVVMPIKM